MEHYDKLRKFWAGAYTFPVPSVSTAAWLSDDWIRFIDREGTWK